jgi:c(7)-type cytochrome triheme protein
VIDRALKNKGASVLQYMLVLFSLLLIASCSSKTRSLFFDVPASEEVQETTGETASQEQSPADAAKKTNASFSRDQEDLERPAIEETLDWDEAQAMLPKDAFGQVDWVAALQDGVIRPQALDPDDLHAEAFKLDFFLKNDNPMFEAWFPHSVHTQWLGCQNCHGVIFPYRDNDMKMGEIFQGKYCGSCHGKVAFALTACARCHQSM